MSKFVEPTKDQLAMVAQVTLVKTAAEFLHWAKCCYYDGRFDSKFFIPDETYDAVERLLKNICPNHPILEVVGKPSKMVGLTLTECTQLVKTFRSGNVVEEELLGDSDAILEDDDLL